MKNTLIVNLFGGPGTGKSTAAAYIFSRLKMVGVDIELVTEFTKDKVWEDNKKVFNNQLYITGKQSFKISRVFGEVDVIINDSPILNGAVYTDKRYLKSAIVEEFMSYGDQNLNIFLNRVSEYNPNGRNETEEDAILIDEKLKSILRLEDIESDYDEIPYIEVDADLDGCNKIIELIVRVLGYINVENVEENLDN